MISSPRAKRIVAVDFIRQAHQILWGFGKALGKRRHDRAALSASWRWILSRQANQILWDFGKALGKRRHVLAALSASWRWILSARPIRFSGILARRLESAATFCGTQQLLRPASIA
jgi:hypothetical protein